MSNNKRYINLPREKSPSRTESGKPKNAGKKKLTAAQTAGHVLAVCGTTFLTLFLIIIITVCIVAVALSVYITQFADSMYDVDLKDVDLSLSSFVYAKSPKTGQYEQTLQISADENRIWVDIDEIPQHTIDAILATEDHRFYEHNGVDWTGTLRAFRETFIRESDVQGGSTVTQQLVRNITLDDSVNIGRKLREIFRALSLEQKYSKHDIIESYLNRIAFGNTTYGIGSASRHYFDKDVSELTVAESCILAGLIRSPVNYNPYVNAENSRIRQLYSLDHMYEYGYINYSDYTKAKNEKVRFRLPVEGDYYGYVDERYNEYYGIQSDNEEEDLYFENTEWSELVDDPYRWNEYAVSVDWYTDAALKEVINDLAELKGISRDSATDLLKKGGYHIYLNVDVEMQSKLEELFKNPYLIRESSWPYPAGTEAKDTLQASFVIMDYSGNVVALAGGLGDKPGDDVYNRATQSVRSIGSTVKPIAVYAPAIDMDKITYSSFLLDMAGEIDDPDNIGEKKKWPQNYYKDYGLGGYMPAWQAMMESTNTISARTLSLVGVQNSFNFLQDKLGITTLDRSRNLTYSSLATGSADIKLYELAAAYQIFGSGGVYYEPALYSKVEDSNGKVVLQQDTVGVQAIEKDSAWVVNRMMKKVVDDVAGSGQYSKIDGIEVIGKTGTANDMTNLLFCGLTPDYVGVVRIGYDDNHEIASRDIDHWRPLARVWHDVMSECTPVDQPRTFTEETSVVVSNYCNYTGLIAGPSCPSTNVGYYKKTNIPETCYDSHDGTYWSRNAQETRPYYKNP